MKHLKIVCLEDDHSLRAVMQDTLTLLEPDANVEVCATVEQLQQLVAHDVNRFDLFMIDIRIQGSDRGIMLSRELRERGCQSVVALMSAYQRPKWRIMEELNLRWLPKPLDADDILALLETVQPARSS